MNNIISKIYDKKKDVFGFPQIYKEINFYPIKVKDVEMKELFYKLFFHAKNYIPDKQIIKMSYLKFLLYVVQEVLKVKDNDVDIKKDLLDFLKYTTKEENIRCFIESANVPDNFLVNIVIDDVLFTEQDFENIREMILEQNGSSIEYVEGYLPELEDKLNFMNRNIDNMDFKDELFSFCALTGLSEQEAGEKTLYQFKNRMEREILLKDYELFKPLEISGQITSKNREEIFKHYLSHIPKYGRYHSILIEKDKFLEDSGLSSADGDGNIHV